MTTTDIETILTELDAIIDDASYHRHSFVNAVVSGRVPGDNLAAWGVQKYHQTCQQNRAFSAIHSRCPHLDVRQYEMSQLIGEETAIADGTEAHYNLMKRFAVAMGCPEDLGGVGPAPAVQSFIDYIVGTCQREHFVLGMLAFYVNERQTPAAVQRLRDYLVGERGLSERDVEWFDVHGDLDTEHANLARALIARYAHEVSDFDVRSRQLVARGCEEWTKLQDFYYEVVMAGVEEPAR